MSRNFFIKFNLDDMSHDMDTLETDAEIAEWVRGFKRGARGEAPSTQTGARLKGNLFGFKACQEADKYRASRAANRAKGHEKKKGLQTSKEETSNNQHPASSIHETMTHVPTYDATYVENAPQMGSDTGASAPDPLPKPPHYARFEKQYQTPKPEPVALPFEETPEGKACLARRAEIRAMRLAKESQRA